MKNQHISDMMGLMSALLGWIQGIGYGIAILMLIGLFLHVMDRLTKPMDEIRSKLEDIERELQKLNDK